MTDNMQVDAPPQMKNTFKIDTTNKESAAKSAVQEMSDALTNQDNATLKVCLKKVKENSLSQAVVECLVPCLFEAEYPGALSLIGCLVQMDASTYLKPISRCVKKEAKLRATSEKVMTVSPAFLHVIVSQLKGTDVEVSSNATEALVDCCQKLGSPLAEQALDLLTNSWKEAWENMVNDKISASTICDRCATAVVELAVINDSIMDLAKSSGALSILLELVNYDRDPLLQMVVMELVEKLANQQPMHPQRAQWLGSDAVLQPLLQMTGATEGGNEADPINGGAALRVLAAICRLGQRDASLFAQHQNNSLMGFHKAIHNFHLHGSGGGELDRLTLIDAISSFASASPEALELVLQDPESRENWLSLSVAQPKLKGAILNSIAMVIDPEPEQDSNGDTLANNKPSNELALRLFSHVGAPKDSTELVLGLAKSPLPETRLGAYNLLRAVAQTDTGSQVLLAHPDFFGWLISREGEPTMEGREGKYDVVQAVLNSPVKGLLAEDIVKKLEKIVLQGAHYVEPLKPDLMTQ